MDLEYKKIVDLTQPTNTTENTVYEFEDKKEYYISKEKKLAYDFVTTSIDDTKNIKVLLYI